MLNNYLKIAWRNLLQNKTFSFINIAGLSVGITAAVFILMWVRNEMNFDNFHPDSNRIFRVTTTLTADNWTWETTPLLLAKAAKQELPEVEEVARLYTTHWPVVKISGNKTYERKAAFVDPNWFKVFKYEFSSGNASAFSEHSKSIILTTSAAKKYFGKANPIGARINIDSADYEVSAVVKDAPANSSFRYDTFLPLSALLANKQRRANDENWDNYNYFTFVRLKPGASPAHASGNLNKIFKKHDQGLTTVSLVALKDMHFESDLQSSEFVHGNLNTVYTFSVLAFLLLLVACINYVNLTTARASLRAKEVSIRKIAGAGSRSLFYRFFADSALISFISLLVTLLLIRLFLPWFGLLTEKNFESAFASPAMWKVIGLALVGVMLLNGIYPAILLSSFKPLNVFRGATVLKVNDGYLRKSLVVIQFIVSVTLIACTIAIYLQMNFIGQADIGYSRSQVLSFPLPANIGSEKKISVIQTVKEELLKQSGIESVTSSNQSVVQIGSFSIGAANWPGRDTAFKPMTTQLSTDADFLNTLNLKMKQGRWFISGNKADNRNVILNETAVAQLKIPAPVIGHSFTFHGKAGQIIGVVKDFKYQSMHEKVGPLVVFNNPDWFNFITVRIAPKSTSGSVVAIQKTWSKILPDYPLEYDFIDQSFNALYKEDRKTSLLLLVFAGIAIVISSLGLFALAAFTAEQRRKEIGIRKVIGATLASLTALLSKDFVKLVLIAVVIACPISYWAITKWLQSFAYRISIGWEIFAFAGILALLIAVLTISVQTVKAAMANPVRSLRAE